MFCLVGMSTLCLAVLCVIPANSTGAKDAIGETALLLDILDLMLQTAEYDQQQQQQQQQIQEAMRHCQQHGTSDQAGDMSHEPALAPSHPADNAASNTDLVNLVAQPDGLTANSADMGKAAPAVPNALAEALLWGLHVLLVSASNRKGFPMLCIKLVTEYIVDQFVMFSCDWSRDVAEVAVQVRVSSVLHVIFNVLPYSTLPCAVSCAFLFPTAAESLLSINEC